MKGPAEAAADVICSIIDSAKGDSSSAPSGPTLNEEGGK